MQRDLYSCAKPKFTTAERVAPLDDLLAGWMESSWAVRDIHPSLYGEPVLTASGKYTSRIDEFEVALRQVGAPGGFADSGVGRGMQMLNIVLGLLFSLNRCSTNTGTSFKEVPVFCLPCGCARPPHHFNYSLPDCWVLDSHEAVSDLPRRFTANWSSDTGTHVGQLPK